MGAAGGQKPARTHCLAMPNGKPCRSKASPGFPYCRRHTGPRDTPRELTPREILAEWRENAERAVARRMNRKPMKGNYDEDLVKAILPLATPLYRFYWRVDVTGVENIPTEGPALLASNHSGTLPLDGAMLKVAVLKEHGRNPWLLAADLVFQVPGLREITRATGNARADREATLDLLRRGELVGVFPEGFKGIGKGWKKRYQLQRFGRGGFVETALRAQVPIIPVAIVGSEEIYPMIADLKPLARLFGFPYFPVTPFFPWLGPVGAIPLPSKWIVEFGEPIHTDEYGSDAWQDAMLVFELTDRVRDLIQRMLFENVMKRRSAFF